MRKSLLSLFAVLVALLPTIVLAQGVLIVDQGDHAARLPRPPMWPHPPHPVPPVRPEPVSTYKIKELSVQTTLNDQVAKVQVTQSFVNTGSTTMEVVFVFPLPYDGAIDRLTFLVDGKEFDGKLLGAEEARRIYEGYIRRNRDPALLEWLGQGMFKTSVFPVPPGAERKVTLRYTQLCRKVSGLTELLFPLSTARYTSQPIEKIDFQVSLQSQIPLKNVYSPTHPIEIKRPSDTNAIVSWSAANAIPGGDFRLLYDVGAQSLAASVLSYRPAGQEDGYFLLLVSPEIKKVSDVVPKKNVVFVVDRSGSMSGPKIEQARGALKFVLNNLREGDLFNIVAYDTQVESFRPEMQRYNDETRQAALGFASGLFAGGSTNIDGAIKVAMAQLTDNSRPNYIVFLTDGLPTAGETNEAKIVANAKERNQIRARVFSMGVGYDVNSRLLDKLARTCFGQSEYVRPNEDIEAQVSKLYNRIGAPALANVTLSVDVEGATVEGGPSVNRVYPREVMDLFAGDQLVLVGRYRKPGAAKISITGSIDGQKQAFAFPGQLVEKSPDESLAFVERLWAMRRVGEIIDEIDLVGKNKELVDELVTLSKRHGILTPYTSFLADDQPGGGIRDFAAQSRRANEALESLKTADGVSGFAQRDAKAMLQRAGSASAPAGPSGSLGGLAGGGGFGRAKFRAVDSDRDVEVQTVQSVGAKTFYLRSGRWVDSTLTDEQEKKVQKVERFSKEYFDLVGRYGKDVAKYLALEGDVTLVLDGQAYSF